MKTYFHIDMDAFFVSVEELFDPSLKGKPVVVGGRPNQRGVVSAASYAARKFGVHSAMPLRTAYRLCPQAIFVDGHPDRYRDYSGRVFRVLKTFSPLVDMASIDEAYMDVTGTERLHDPPLQAAHRLHEAMKRETLLNCSIGIAVSRLVAKIASDQAKPNGVLWIVPGQEARFLAVISPRSMRLSWNRVSDSGAWRWLVNPVAWTPGAGTTLRSAKTPDPNRSATSIRFPKTPPTRRSSKRRWRGSRKWWAAACASMRCLHARSS
jgi:hypothetical protein